jgi:hypothetical protein
MSDDKNTPKLSIEKPPGDFNPLAAFAATNKDPPIAIAASDDPLEVMHPAKAGYFFRVHPDEANYWTDTLYFINARRKPDLEAEEHLIIEPLARQKPGKVTRFRLALAKIADGPSFLARVPVGPTDNKWIITAMEGIEAAKTKWVELVSQKKANPPRDFYVTEHAFDQDKWREVDWLRGGVTPLVMRRYDGLMITDPSHPAWLDLIGAKQKI